MCLAASGLAWACASHSVHRKASSLRQYTVLALRVHSAHTLALMCLIASAPEWQEASQALHRKASSLLQ
jgi:hypothetical protein